MCRRVPSMDSVQYLMVLLVCVLQIGRCLLLALWLLLAVNLSLYQQ